MKKCFLVLLTMFVMVMAAMAQGPRKNLPTQKIWDKLEWYGATQREWKELGSDSKELSDGGFYYVSKDLTIDHSSSACSGLILRSGTAMIYVPKGVTLTVKADTTYAGIEVYKTANLILAGQGKIVAVGGDAVMGSNGECGDGTIDKNGNKGVRGYVSCNDNKGPAGSVWNTGSGGRGGKGGSGGGAAIGAKGGVANPGGWGGPYGTQNNNDDHNYWTDNGENGIDGNMGWDMGKVYIFGSLDLVLTKGSQPASGASGGDCTGDDTSHNWGGNYYCAGSGGGGGAGGNGYAAKYAIGGGGGAGGSGAGGHSGGYSRNCWSSNIEFRHGNGGAGGEGSYGVAEEGKRHSNDYPWDDSDAAEYNETPTSGGKAGANGDNGSLFTNSINDNDNFKQLVERDFHVYKTVAEFREAEMNDSAIVSMAVRTLNFSNDKNIEAPEPVEFFDFMEMAFPVAAAKSKLAEDAKFYGYADENGNMVIDENGNPVADNPYFINKNKKYYVANRDDIELHPVFGLHKDVLVTHVFSNPDLPEGDPNEFKETASFNENVNFYIKEGTTMHVTVYAKGTADWSEDTGFQEYKDYKKIANTVALGDKDGKMQYEFDADDKFDDSKPVITFYHRYEKRNVSWVFNDGGKLVPLSDEKMSSIAENKDFYGTDAEMHINQTIVAPNFKGDKGYDCTSWLIDGKEQPALPATIDTNKDGHVFCAVFTPQQFYVKTSLRSDSLNIKHGKFVFKDATFTDSTYVTFGTKMQFYCVPDSGYVVDSIATFRYSMNDGKEEISDRQDIPFEKDEDTSCRYDLTIPNYNLYMVASFKPIDYKLKKNNIHHEHGDGYITVVKKGSVVEDNNVYTDDLERCTIEGAKDIDELTYNVGNQLLVSVMPNEQYLAETKAFQTSIEASYNDGENVFYPESSIDIESDGANVNVTNAFSVICPPANLTMNVEYDVYDKQTVTFSSDALQNVKPVYVQRNNTKFDLADIDAGKTNAANGELVIVAFDRVNQNTGTNLSDSLVNVTFVKDGVEYGVPVFSLAVGQRPLASYFFYFQMPDAPVAVTVGETAEGKPYKVGSIGFSSYTVRTVNSAISGTSVGFMVLSGVPDMNLDSVSVAVLDGENQPIDFNFDPETGFGSFVMPENSAYIVLADKQEHLEILPPLEKQASCEDRHFSTLFSPLKHIILPDYAKAFAAVNLRKSHYGHITIDLVEIHRKMLPANVPAIIESERETVNLIPILKGKGGYIVDNLLKVNDGFALESEEITHLLSIEDVEDGAVFSAKREAELNEVVLPVNKQKIIELLEGENLADEELRVYIARIIDPTGVERLEMQLVPVASGAFTIGGIPVDPSKELPAGVYVIDGQKVSVK